MRGGIKKRRNKRMGIWSTRGGGERGSAQREGARWSPRKGGTLRQKSRSREHKSEIRTTQKGVGFKAAPQGWRVLVRKFSELRYFVGGNERYQVSQT